jgi:hypothetical protein
MFLPILGNFEHTLIRLPFLTSNTSRNPKEVIPDHSGPPTRVLDRPFNVFKQHLPILEDLSLRQTSLHIHTSDSPRKHPISTLIMSHFMPFRGERTAPVFDRNQPSSLCRYFTQLEILFARHGMPSHVPTELKLDVPICEEDIGDLSPYSVPLSSLRTISYSATSQIVSGIPYNDNDIHHTLAPMKGLFDVSGDLIFDFCRQCL